MSADRSFCVAVHIFTKPSDKAGAHPPLVRPAPPCVLCRRFVTPPAGIVVSYIQPPAVFRDGKWECDAYLPPESPHDGVRPVFAPGSQGPGASSPQESTA